MTNIVLRVALVAAIGMSPATAATAASTSNPSTTVAVDGKAAGAFIQDLSGRAFAVLRNKSMDRTAVRAKFRELLKQNFAIDEIGNRLIRRHVRTISKAQYDAYLAAFPDYVVDTYTDNMFKFADSELKVIRSVPRGTRGNVDVYTRVFRRDGAQPLESIWSVKQDANGKYLINNLTVSGVNLSLTQEADFNAYITRNGFDALIQFMKGRKTA